MKVVEPPAEASSTFQFWTDLAHRLGLGNEFPWTSLEDMLDYRLSRSDRTFAEFADDLVKELSQSLREADDRAATADGLLRAAKQEASVPRHAALLHPTCSMPMLDYADMRTTLGHNRED